MKYIKTDKGLEKYDENTHEPVNIENDVIIGAGTTIIIKTDSKWVYWDKFNKPNSLKEYGNNAVEITQALFASQYRLSDAGTPIYYDSTTETLTTRATDNVNAIVDGTDPEELESNLLSDGSCVLKDVNVLVSCGSVNRQSIIDTGQEDLNEKELKRNCAKALIENHDSTQDLAVFNAIKDKNLIGADFGTLCTTIMEIE